MSETVSDGENAQQARLDQLHKLQDIAKFGETGQLVKPAKLVQLLKLHNLS